MWDDGTEPFSDEAQERFNAWMDDALAEYAFGDMDDERTVWGKCAMRTTWMSWTTRVKRMMWRRLMTSMNWNISGTIFELFMRSLGQIKG